jgi:hypothetical protein
MPSLLPFCLLALAAAASSPLSATVHSDGSYTVVSPLGSWQSAATSLLSNGQWLSSSNGTLVHLSLTFSSGEDAWGSFNSSTSTWGAAGGSSAVLLSTAVLQYTSGSPALHFLASFPSGLTSGSGGVNDSAGLLCTFPSFQLPAQQAQSPLGFFQFAGTMLNQKNDSGPLSGPFWAGANFSEGLGSGPVVVFDSQAAFSLVLSASSQFMATSAAATEGGRALSWGPLGSAAAVPAGWGYSAVAWGGQGINSNMMSWGAALLALHGKRHGLSKSDFTSTHLGYNSDHGSFYYYNVGGFGNYSVALAQVHAYAQSQGIPFRHVLLDSFWYYKQPPKGGTLNWTAQDSSPYFTGGNAGIAELVALTGWKVIAHNRYWSRYTQYAKQNGGQWDFALDTSQEDGLAVPLQQSFWEWLLSSSAAQWGLSVYEQDWLHNELENMPDLLTNLTLARTWMLQMGAGCEAAGISMQLCMPYPRHALQSVELPTATQIRVTDDHMPGPGGGNTGTQWTLGFSALLAWSLGLAPFKDSECRQPLSAPLLAQRAHALTATHLPPRWQ